MKQFVIGRINLLEKFMECIGEKVKDVGEEGEKQRAVIVKIAAPTI